MGLGHRRDGLGHRACRRSAEVVRKTVIGRALRSKLAPIITAAKFVRKSPTGIRNAVVFRGSKAEASTQNSIPRGTGRKTRVFRNRARFNNAIEFSFGALDLYQRPLLTPKRA